VALQKAFEPDEFRGWLLTRLDRHWDTYVGLNAKYPSAVLDIITAANRQGWIVPLIEAARAENPENADLYEFGERLEVVSVKTPVLKQALERVVKKTNKFFDAAQWRTKLGKIEPTVCRIEIAKDEYTVIYGTGFLLGPNALVTNYHVMGAVIAGEIQPSAVACRFDYKRNSGNAIDQGKTYGLAENWLIDSSPSFPLDQPAPEDRLDYALLRLGEAPGNDPIMPVPGAAGVARGWLAPLPAYGFPADSPLFILQHPQGDPLKLALDTDSVIEVRDQTRVRHRTNTEEGSSGSPCFNQDWELVALHHSGDPNFARNPAYNEAIPFEAILKLLTKRGLAKAIEG
jgi:hypothetical protein